ncbi:MAG: hypothetical protein AVDCRST_MAG38-2678 [uncultured Solirubrobacteraceae bacterium]|uniref:Uncharacterized protein n=1 Tax=uncultured Solirubrobacteraceae bacterium TaxID=1162706 RepID=A0A6J4SHX8_9ACTN|nr:MAG: hypothetical protein AVDCRST_MAG38-2678 [uncultured Solirubrobacteraceae bacterium]
MAGLHAPRRVGRDVDGHRIEAPDRRALELQRGERAQEAVRDEHVDLRLRGLVEAARQPAGQRGIEVGHLDAHLDLRVLGVRRGPAAHLELEEAADVVAGTRHEQAAADPPADDPAVAGEHVLGRREAQEDDRAADQHHGAVAGRIGDAHEAERRAGQELPVGARQALHVHGRPHRLQRGVRQPDQRDLDGADGAAVVHDRVARGAGDDRLGPASAGRRPTHVHRPTVLVRARSQDPRRARRPCGAGLRRSLVLAAEEHCTLC